MIFSWEGTEYQSKHFTWPFLRPKDVISVSDISLLISMAALGSLVALVTASMAATFSGQAAYQSLAIAPIASGVVTVTTQPNALSGLRAICHGGLPMLRTRRTEAGTEGV